MTARTTGPGRAPGAGGTPKRPAKRPATGRPAGSKTTKDNPAGLTVVEAVEDDEAPDATEASPDVTPAPVDVVEAPADVTEAVDAPEDAAAEDVVIDLVALETADEATLAVSTDPAGIPPIDANVLLRAILTPAAGIANGDGITDALTGAVPTWRLDEEPIYLETIRDLGVPAVPEADGGTGEVIVGEIVEQEA